MSDDPNHDNGADEVAPDRSLEALRQAEEKAVDTAFKKLFGKYETVATAAIGIASVIVFIFSLYKVIFTELSDNSYTGFMVIIFVVFLPGFILSAIKIFGKNTSV